MNPDRFRHLLIGRLLISLLLVNWNLLPLPLLYLRAYFEKHRNDYYDLLLAVSERGAWREWLMFSPKFPDRGQRRRSHPEVILRATVRVRQ